jgi:hypothetical protein
VCAALPAIDKERIASGLVLSNWNTHCETSDVFRIADGSPDPPDDPAQAGRRPERSRTSATGTGGATTGHSIDVTI